MLFQGFDWLSGHGIRAIISCPRNSDYMNCFPVVLAKRNQPDLAISTHACWKYEMIIAPRWPSIISYPTCACGIIVTYISPVAG